MSNFRYYVFHRECDNKMGAWWLDANGAEAEQALVRYVDLVHNHGKDNVMMLQGIRDDIAVKVTATWPGVGEKESF